MGKKDFFRDFKEEAAKPSTISLKNCSLRAVAFNLPCDPCCKGSRCLCAIEEREIADYDASTGEHVRRVVSRKICASLTLLAGERKGGLSPSVLLAPDVKAALSRGELVVT